MNFETGKYGQEFENYIFELRTVQVNITEIFFLII